MKVWIFKTVALYDILNVIKLELAAFSFERRDAHYLHHDIIGFCFMLFVVIFQIKYLTVEGSEILLRFFARVWSLGRPDSNISVTLPSARRRVGLDDLTKGVTFMVVCPKCRALYPYLLNGEQRISMARMEPEEARANFGTLMCTNNPFEFGSSSRMCNENLFYHTETNLATPRMVCPYNSITESIRTMFMRPGFADILQHWKRYPLPEGYVADFYHGKLWHDIVDVNQGDFVENEYALSLSLGIDWFRAGNWMNHSTGGVYLYVNNLPLHLRTKMSNTILVAVLPGPKEQTIQQLNYLMRYITIELETLFSGVRMYKHGESTPITVYAAMHLIVSDLPAQNKISGFVGTNGHVSCRCCFYKYPRRENMPSQVNYGANINLEDIPRRTGAQHRENGLLWRDAPTAAERKLVQDTTGSKYSCIQDLLYLDLIRSNPYEPMHTVTCGLCGKLMDHWINVVANPDRPNQKLLSHQLENIANDIAKINLPSGYQKPSREKILAGFSGLKAAEWRTFLLCLSPIVLLGRLTGAHWQIWCKFQKGMTLLEQPIVSKDQMKEAHGLFEEVVALCVDNYGQDFIVPKFHSLLHFEHMMIDCGHIRGFSSYAVERDNLTLKNYNSNFKTGFELTMMKKFKEEFHKGDLIRSINPATHTGKIIEQFLVDTFLGDNASAYSIDDFDIYCFVLDSMNPFKLARGCEPLPPSDVPVFNEDKATEISARDHGLLVDYCNALNALPTFSYIVPGDASEGIPVNYTAHIFKDITLVGQTYRSLRSVSNKDQLIKTLTFTGECLVGEIQYFFASDIPLFVDGDWHSTRHYFAFCRWYQPPSFQLTSINNSGLYIVKKFFRQADHTCILPVHKIYSCVTTYPAPDNHLYVLDIPRKISSDN
jgi:hypothetical protein